jgi:MADS-box transcription factor
MGSRHQSQEPSMMPHHLQNQAAFQHMRQHQPSASPPVPNGLPYNAPHGHTPQPQMGSRPSSRNAVRRPSSLATQHGPPQAAPGANGYTYMGQPAMHNPPNNPQMAGVPQPYITQAPGYPQYAGPVSQHPQQHPLQQQSAPQQGPPSHQQQQPQPVPYMDDRRQSMPPSFPQHERHGSGQMSTPPHPQHQQLPQHHGMSQLRQTVQAPQHQQHSQGPQPVPHAPPQHHEEPAQPKPQPAPSQLLEPVKRMSVKSHSIFTPIDESRSILSQHWASSTSAAETLKAEAAPRSHSVDGEATPKQTPIPPPQPRHRTNTHAKQRNASVSSNEAFAPPSRTNSAQLNAKRPRLALQIPDEPSDEGNGTAGSSPPGSASGTGADSTRRTGTEGSHSSGMVLPPPSPSASALLSAGASGPPNPFARPHPPNQNNQSDRNSNHIDTPVSALPSRFMNNDFLPSPSSFYPEWNFRGSDSNTLPSPLNFATPINSTGPSFLREDSGPSKRKTPETEEMGGDSKRVKHEA